MVDLVTDKNGKSVGVFVPISDRPKPVDSIALNRDHAADAVAIVRLLRTNQPDMAMFILGAYGDDNDALQGLAALSRLSLIAFLLLSILWLMR